MNESKILLLKKKKQSLERAQVVVEKFLAPVNEQELLGNLAHINQCHFEDIIIERSITKLCGYPLCKNELKEGSKQQYRIDLASKKVYDVTERNNFCSSNCYKAANYLKEQLPTTPLWLRDLETVPDFKLLQLHQWIRNQPAYRDQNHVISAPLSKWVLRDKIEDIVEFVRSQKKEAHIFTWVTPKNISHPFALKFLLHLSDFVLHFDGKSLNQQVKQKLLLPRPVKSAPVPSTSFKIGDLSSSEAKAKEELQMAYEKVKSGSLVTNPDDFEDEDDPDDDLDV